MSANCAFEPCGDGKRCPLVGGCVQVRFKPTGHSASTREVEKPKAQALNGMKPSRMQQKAKTTR